MKKLEKNEKGITLVALIISVLVLFIGIGIMIARANAPKEEVVEEKTSFVDPSNVLILARNDINLSVMDAKQNYYERTKGIGMESSAYNVYLDEAIMNAVTDIQMNTYNVVIKKYNGKSWDIKNKTITLYYGGATLTGKLEAGVLTWGEIQDRK